MNYEEILSELVSRKCKLTPQRKELLKVLVRAKAPLSAQEILERLRKVLPQISFDTVYRNLAVLHKLQILERLDFQDGRSRYEISRMGDHHHHVICLKCGGAWKLRGCPLEQVAGGMGPDSFMVTGHRFELFGYCKACQK